MEGLLTNSVHCNYRRYITRTKIFHIGLLMYKYRIDGFARLPPLRIYDSKITGGITQWSEINNKNDHVRL